MTANQNGLEKLFQAIAENFGEITPQSLLPYVRPLKKHNSDFPYSADCSDNEKRILEIDNLSVERKGL